MAQEDIVVGLDIGSSKICAMIGEIQDNGTLRILGHGVAVSEGLRAGVVVNIESTLKSVSEAIETAEQMAGREVSRVHIGIAGSHVEGINSRGVVAIARRGREINQQDVERVMEAAKAVVLPSDRDIVHWIPQEFKVDSTPGVKNPVDMIGVRLEAEVHLITASMTAAQNLVRCVNRAGFEVDGISLSALAAGKAVLSADEMEMGCLFIDIGGGTTDFIVYKDGAPIYTSVLPIGGNAVSSDISIILQTTIENAEILKTAYGAAWMAIVDNPEEPALLQGFLGRNPIKVTRMELCQFIQPRMQEILGLVKQKIERDSKLRAWGSLGAGVILTGGGSMLPGTAELASEVFGLGAHIGVPSSEVVLSTALKQPDMATAYGLVLEAISGTDLGTSQAQAPERNKVDRVSKVKKFFSSFF